MKHQGAELFPGEGLPLLVDLHTLALDADLRGIANRSIRQLSSPDSFRIEGVRASFGVVHRTSKIQSTPENAHKHVKDTLSKMIQNQSVSPAESSPALSRRFSVAPMMDWNC